MLHLVGFTTYTMSLLLSVIIGHSAYHLLNLSAPSDIKLTTSVGLQRQVGILEVSDGKTIPLI